MNDISITLSLSQGEKIISEIKNAFSHSSPPRQKLLVEFIAKIVGKHRSRGGAMIERSNDQEEQQTTNESNNNQEQRYGLVDSHLCIFETISNGKNQTVQYFATSLS